MDNSFFKKIFKENKVKTKSELISEISNLENISDKLFMSNINIFEKTIKKISKRYDDNTGLEDYKMNKNDYIILLILYKSTDYSQYKLLILLYYIYSYYKMDNIDFNYKDFPLNYFFKFIKNNTIIHHYILEFMKI